MEASFLLAQPRIAIEHPRAKAVGISPNRLRTLARSLRRAGRQLGINAADWETLSVAIVDDAAMVELNRRFRDEAKATDVLAFPMAEGAPEIGVRALGDIVLNWDQVLRQATDRRDPAIDNELVVLAVHGLVHLLGHDHLERAEGRKMHRLEARVLRSLRVPDIPRPYA